MALAPTEPSHPLSSGFRSKAHPVCCNSLQYRHFSRVLLQGGKSFCGVCVMRPKE